MNLSASIKVYGDGFRCGGKSLIDLLGSIIREVFVLVRNEKRNRTVSDNALNRFQTSC